MSTNCISRLANETISSDKAWARFRCCDGRLTTAVQPCHLHKKWFLSCLWWDDLDVLPLSFLLACCSVFSPSLQPFPWSLLFSPREIFRFPVLLHLSGQLKAFKTTQWRSFLSFWLGWAGTSNTFRGSSLVSLLFSSEKNSRLDQAREH